MFKTGSGRVGVCSSGEPACVPVTGREIVAIISVVAKLLVLSELSRRA
jgi:hypothetical protein